MTVAAPHREAETAGAAILAEGGNAIEAAVAMAAALTVVYPHMTGLGGDGFWLISEPGKPPVGIRACGPSAAAATTEWYGSRGLTAIPPRGPAAALTVAGAVSGWQRALELSKSWNGILPLERLLADARTLALRGMSVSRSQAALLRTKTDLHTLPGFLETFAPHGWPAEGAVQVHHRWAAVFEQLASAGLDDFYRGDLARSLAVDLAAAGSPLTLADLEAYSAAIVEPLSVELSVGTVYNLPPPTQGVSSLAILALFDRLGVKNEGFEHIHGLVEATKKAFAWRNAHVTDPSRMQADPRDFLSGSSLEAMAHSIDKTHASPWPIPSEHGDTVWFGSVDDQGRAVSVIQSIYWEFGSGVILPRTGLLWQNRGSSFTLDSGVNRLEPGKLPFHTLNPALARLNDGRTIAYGTMGGEGQPQTQAALLTRHVWFGESLADAVAAPRWLLGRTWGEDTTLLRLENRFPPTVIDSLKKAGHPVELVEPFDDRMGHAGAVVTGPQGTQGVHDPRADGGGLSIADPGPWRLRKFLSDLARFGAQPDGGVTRLLYDEAWSSAREWLKTEFARMGLTVRDDRVGNLYGRVEGTEPGKAVLTGSHFDTVKSGGWYDGAYGVAASAVALAELVRVHGRPRRTIEVVAFCEEEGSRFPLAYWGSGHLVGRWPTGHGDTQKDSRGITLSDAMDQAGFGRQEQPEPLRTDLAAFVEIHVEQGIVLERAGERIGVVEAIVGQRRWLIRLSGEANHAGTTPMGLRRDALAGAAEMMTLIENEAKRFGDPLVATVGFAKVLPNTPNVIPGNVAFSVDARHTDEQQLEAFCAGIRQAVEVIAKRRGVEWSWEPRMSVAPAPMDAGLRRRIVASCKERQLSYRILPSGAGHDSQVLSAVCPTAMIFVPSRHGVSHSPQEYSHHQALSDGLAVLSDVLYDLAWKGTAP
jgi:gamma-glutamyltranspeptidase/glutathione hydrolase